MRLRHLQNACAHDRQPYTDAERSILCLDSSTQVQRDLVRCPAHRATPLLHLPGLARTLGVAMLWYKDEGQRFGLKSFKSLGGAYAVGRVLLREIARQLQVSATFDELKSGQYAHVTSKLTVCCATDGNHGKSVAFGARHFGCVCVVYVHEGVTDERVAAIESFGARVIRTPGNYDDSVAAARDDAARRGWFAVADISWPAYEDVPADVMRGYTVIAAECIEEIERGATSCTHVLVQAGVGGLAAAMAGVFAERYGTERPTVIVVEPLAAACLLETATRDSIVRIPGELATAMGMLACGEPSPLAWQILRRRADHFLAIDDGYCFQAMQALAAPGVGEPPIVAGESGAAGLAGLYAALETPEVAQAMGLDAHSRVLVIGTEAATDETSYAQIVGRSSQQVLDSTSRAL